MAMEWLDRVPRYPGRVKLTPVAGQTNLYDMERADEPTVAGTPINAANLNAMQKISVEAEADTDYYIAVIDDDGVIRRGKQKSSDIPDGDDTEELGIDSTPIKDSANLVTSGGVYAYVNNLNNIPWNSVACSEMCSSALFDEGDYEIRYQGFTFPVFYVKRSDTYAEYEISATIYVYGENYIEQRFCQLRFVSGGRLQNNGCYSSSIYFASTGDIAIGEKTLLSSTSNKLYFRKIR